MVTLKDALFYLSQGFSLVPICPRQKRPLREVLPQVDGAPSWKMYQEAPPTEAEVRGWFRQVSEMNLAAVCGQVSGGLVVIDFDIDAARNWARWRERTRLLSDLLPVVETGKGVHVYLRYRERVSSIQLAKNAGGGILIESRGEGSLCLLPPSVHPNGRTYCWLSGGPESIPMVTTRQYVALLGAAAGLNERAEKVYVPPKRAASKNTTSANGMEKRVQAYAQAVLSRLTQELAETTAGGRNAQLNRTAFICGRYVGAGLLEADAVEAALEEACLMNGYIMEDGPQAFAKTLSSGLDAGQQRPVNVAALQMRLRGG